jgi:hypothetical protein
VIVFDTLGGMRKAAGKFGDRRKLRCHGACAHYAHEYFTDEWLRTKPRGFRGELGAILLQRKHLDAPTVAHECCHAMIATVQRNTHILNMHSPRWREVDEVMATMLGSYVEQINTKLLRLKLID